MGFREFLARYRKLQERRSESRGGDDEQRWQEFRRQSAAERVRGHHS